ncbi:hypothetical protein [Streptomyces sp. NPDC050535]|uniref:hypothetical protein n=1 Tax=Streptomyces sp. NPDC050535 TaxID=3365626 RepID=UPI0037A7F2E2
MVEATVISAFATAQGISAASRATAKLEATPTPPPDTTNRAKEASGPGAAGARCASSEPVSIPSMHCASYTVPGFDESGSDSMGFLPDGGRESLGISRAQRQRLA